ncbi:Amino acid/polyamine transporter I [Cinnamomum micranthum f. kanehirae]|uniref:Amino acid/polyamine transporter I n=1 Tax=Cinnamomum micranthum f. kanehirae TaxID=337451 RepID=A0A3S4NIH4_9MAGN|nr:Amino acid/polyamine transporter I [Cinnamomum micranthum f. kanehirae]
MKAATSSSSSQDLPHQLQQQDEPNKNKNGIGEIEESKEKKRSNKLKLIPLIFLIFFEVSGGPFGEEPAVAAAGPLLAILGFIIFPFIWSIPEALVTAELATTFPGNGGFVIWADRAFGPFWGSMMGSWKFFSGAINNGAFPALLVEYVKHVIPAVSGGLPRILTILFFNIILAFVNYTGLTIVGYTSVTLGTFALLPFLLMAGFSIPKIRPRHWIELGDRNRDWRLYFNTLFWNLNFWDSASTLAGEVERPQQTFPKALFSAGIITCLGYLIPLLAGIGALDVGQEQWTDGFLADAAGMIAGKWLKYWVSVASVLSVVGLFEAQLSASSYQLLGMANLELLPRIVAVRSRWFDTPWVGILVTSLITLGISYIGFENIINSANFLYALGMLLEFASFVWLRRKYPGLKRPFRVPMGTAGVVCMCIVPSAFLVLVMVIGGAIVFAVSGGLTVVGVMGYFLMEHCKKRRWMEFRKDEEEVAAAAVDGAGEGDGGGRV